MKNIKSPILLAMIIASTSTIFAQGITINGGAHLVMNGAVSIVVNNGSIKNNGVFAANTSTVKFTGNADTANSIVSGNSNTDFYNLTIAKSNYGLVSPRNTSCDSNNIVSSSGNLYLNNNLVMASSVRLKNKSNLSCKSKKISTN